MGARRTPRRTSAGTCELTAKAARRGARGSWSGRSRPCPSSSTRTPGAGRRCCGTRCGGSGIYLFFGNDDRRARRRGRAPHLRRGQAARPAGRARRCATTRCTSCPSASTCPCSRSSRSAGASRPSSSQEVLGLHPGHGGRHRRASTATASAASSATRRSSRTSSAASPAAGRGAAGQHHERRLVRDHLGALPAPGHGRLPRGREPPLPGARREHRHHRGRGPAGPRARADARSSSRRSSCARCPFVAETTFYTRHGDVFAQACAAVALALVGRDVRAGRRRRMDGSEETPVSADLRQRLEPLRARAADIRGYL